MPTRLTYLDGWILDAYPVANGMRVWFITPFGRTFSCLDTWFPSFYIKADPSDTPHIQRLLQSFHVSFTVNPVEKKDFYTNETITVIRIQVHNPLVYNSVVTRLLKLSLARQSGRDKITLFDADINLVQAYFYDRALFPLARCWLKMDANSNACPSGRRVREWVLHDSCWDLDYELPPFRYAHLGFETAARVDPNHSQGGTRGRGRRGPYVLTLGREQGQGTSYLFDESEEELLNSLNRHIKDWDPDILLSDWGDSYIMPRLQMHSQRTGIPVCFSRDPQKNIGVSSDHSFFSYGKFVYRAGPRTLFGRLHIDVRNSFTVSHNGLEGLFEIARVAKIPLQRAARCTIGTSLSSMQHFWAVQNNYLIPLDKGQTEEFRSGDEFIVSDRGGLVYEPEIGWHEDLIEFDFVSMYPEIMVRNNITPEAVNCSCCPDNKVPEIKHHLCRKRKGMVPAVLGPIVEKRRQYKELVKVGHPNKETYEKRRDAFKWALVTCFGYLGFRNARFGRIEAHECVNAYSREALLRAKAVAEEEGFHFIHGIIDCLWLKKPGVTDEEVESLRVKIEKATGLPLGFEGRYHWVRFCPSRQNKRAGVPNRYFGVFNNGNFKVRGIEIRRHDTPPFIKNLQESLLKEMAKAKNLAELYRMRPRIEAIIDNCRDALRSGHMAPTDLAVTLQLSRDPGDYVNNTLSAIAAKKMAASGVKLHLGESIQYVVAEEHDAVEDWRVTPLAFIEDYFEYDLKYYERLLDRALDMTPFFPLSSTQKKGGTQETKTNQLFLPGFSLSAS